MTLDTIHPAAPPPLPRRLHDPTRERIGAARTSAPHAAPVSVSVSLPAPVSVPVPDITTPTIDPVLIRLAAELPTLSSALVCSADGRVLAAYGLTADEETPLAVLVSSLHAMSAATAKADEDRPLDHVTLASGGTQTVVLTVPSAAGHPLLALTVDDISLGRLLVLARKTADAVGEALQRSAR